MDNNYTDDLISSYSDLMYAESAMDVTVNAVAGLESLESIADDNITDMLISAQRAIIGTLPIDTELVSLEGMGDNKHEFMSFLGTMRTIWNVLWAVLKRAAKAAAKWFRANFTKVGRLKKAANALSLKAFNSKSTPGQKEILVRNPEYLYDGEQAVGLETKGIHAVASYLRFSAPVKNMHEISRIFITGIKGRAIVTDEDVDAFTADMDARINDYNTSMLKDFKQSTSKGDTEVYEFTIPDFPGDTHVLARKPSGAFPVRITFVPMNTKKNKGTRKHKALDAGEISNVCSAIERTSDLILNSYDKITEMSDIDKGIEKAGKSLLKSLGDGISKNKRSTIEKQLRVIQTIGVNGKRPIVDSVRAGTAVLSAAYGFALDSYENLHIEDTA